MAVNTDQLEHYVHYGELKKLKHLLSSISPAELPGHLCSETNNKTSLIMKAVIHQRVKIVQFLLAHYRAAIDINHKYTATPSLHLNTQLCSLLHAACLMYYVKKSLKLTKFLLKAGASPNVGDSRGNTPLHAVLLTTASKDILHCLVECGADVNVSNELGVTPLMIAAVVFSTPIGGRWLDANASLAGCDVTASLTNVRFLLKHGANANIVDVRGFSVLHHFAFGKVFTRVWTEKKKEDPRVQILQELLLAGADPMFKSAPSSQEERQQYVPCPLYIAASWGRKEIVKVLLKHPQCLPVCKAEAYLLLASTECDENRLWLSLHTQDLWSKALCIYEENDIHPAYLPPIEAYGNRVEIRSVKELQELSYGSMSLHEAYYQSLIIRERCIGMGCGCLSLINAISKRAKTFLTQRKNAEAERLYLHTFDVVLHVLNHIEVYNEEIADFNAEPYVKYSNSLSQWLEELCTLGLKGYVPNFQQFMRYATKLFDVLLKRSVVESFHYNHVLLDVVGVYATASTMHFDATPDTKLSHVQDYSLEELGHEFVSKLLQNLTTLSTVHDSVFHLLSKDEFQNFYSDDINTTKYYSVILNALLRWGAYRVIDQPELCSKGQRFLHAAVVSKYASSFLPILLEYSPHLDAVDADGKTAFDLCTSDELRSLFPSTPHPLSCQAAKVVVSENTPYQELDLPAHIKSLISLHDCHHLRRQ